MMKEHVVRGVKITLGIMVSVSIAIGLNMDFYSMAGTIALVSMLDKKKRSFKNAVIRLIVALLSLTFAAALFSVLGFTTLALGIYLMVFTIVMSKLDTMLAAVLNVGLVMQVYFLGQVSFAILANQLGLMFLGIMAALIFNFYSVDIEGELIEYKKKLEKHLRVIFYNMSLCLTNEGNSQIIEEELKSLKETIDIGKKRAYDDFNNYYIQKNNYYVEYFTMRSQQYHIIRSMPKYLAGEFLEESEAMMLKQFTEEFFMNTRILGSYEIQLRAINSIKLYFDEIPLPTSQERLKNRINLYQYLFSMQDLTYIMIRFLEKVKKPTEE